MKKQVAYMLLTFFCILLCIPDMNVKASEPVSPGTNVAIGTYGYEPEAAVSYAATHIAEEMENGNVCEKVCDQFVKECLSVGGVTVRAGDVKPVMDALVDAGFGTACQLTISADGVHIKQEDNPGTKAGDVLFIYCEACEDWIHTTLISGFDESGNMLSYGHNPIWNQVDYFGNMTHEAENGEVHAGCYQFYAVNMDTTKSTHMHGFTTDLYEASHPHKMYDECSCGAKYYLGWNATVKSCTSCNPPIAEVPVITTAQYSEEDGAIFIEWSTVYDVVEYELHRAKKENGTYFKIATTNGVKITNTSFDLGTTYYYKVIAVRANDTLESAVVSVKAGSGLPPAPVASGYLREDTGKPRIKWTEVNGAEKYEVYRSTDGTNFPAAPSYTTTNGLSYTNTGAAAGKTYYYKVVAVLGEDRLESNVVKLMVAAEDFVIEGTYRDDGKPRLVWDKVSGVTAYEIYRSTDNKSFSKIYTTKYLSYTNTSAEAGVTYFYKVKAGDVESNGVKLVVAAEEFVIEGTYRDDGKPRLVWDKISGVTTYEIYRSTDNKNFSKIYTTKYLSYTNTSAVSGVTYYYKVKAGDVESNVVELTVEAEEFVIEGTYRDDGKPRLIWDKVSGVTTYEIYRSTDGVNFNQKYTTKYTSFTNTSAEAGVTYYYKVKAGDVESNVVELAVAAEEFAIEGTYRADGKPRLVWEKVGGVSEYVIYRSTDGINFTKIYTTQYASYTNTSAKSGVTYYYKVQAGDEISNVVALTVK